MTVRTWIYGQLITLDELVGDRVFAKKTMTSSIEQHPYIVYSLGYNANEDLAEDTDVTRQFIQVFVHDFNDGDNADYMRIDQVIHAIKQVFHLKNSAEDGVIAIQYVETSQDLNDETLNTVFKYARFQLTTKEQ